MHIYITVLEVKATTAT